MKPIQRIYVFGKTETDKNGKQKNRYWGSISSPIWADGQKTDQYARAEIPVILSKESAEVFEHKKVGTKNPTVFRADLEVTEMWLVAKRGKDADIVALFINDVMEV